MLPTLVAACREGGELRSGADAAAVAREPGWTVLRSFKRLLDRAGPQTRVEIAPRGS